MTMKKFTSNNVLIKTVIIGFHLLLHAFINYVFANLLFSIYGAVNLLQPRLW